MSASGKQVGGSHYIEMSTQPWDVMRSVMTEEEFTGFLWGNVLKYAMRWPMKGRSDDLRKTIHYCEKLIEFLNEPSR